MNIADSMRRAGRSLREAKLRTLLTSLAIAVGAFTVTLSLAAGEGSRQYTDRLISSNVDAQLLLIAKDESLFGGDASMTGTSGLTEYSETQLSSRGISLEQVTDEDVEKIAGIEGVESPKPVVQVSSRYMEFEGSDKRYNSDIMMYGSGLVVEAAAGTLPTGGEQLGDREIVIPESYLEELEVDDPRQILGKRVVITMERAANIPSEDEIAQAFASGGPAAAAALSGLESREYEFTVRAVTRASSMAVMEVVSAPQVSAEAAKEMYDFSTSGTSFEGVYFAVAARAESGEDPKEVKQRVEEAGYFAQTAEDFQEMIFIVVNILQGIVIGFGILALIASVFGVINTQYISVLERTQQIGLMKALGMRGADVARLFRYEAAWLGLLGGVIGAVAAYGLGVAINPWITETLRLGEGNSLLVFEILPAVILIVALAIVAIVAGYFPARKAAKLDPIEALRTE